MHLFCVDNLVDVCVGGWQMYAFIGACTFSGMGVTK